MPFFRRFLPIFNKKSHRQKKKKLLNQQEQQELLEPNISPNLSTEPPNIHGRTIEYDLPQKSLPDGWEYRLLEGSRILYVNMLRQICQFEHPSKYIAEGSDVGSGGR